MKPLTVLSSVLAIATALGVASTDAVDCTREHFDAESAAYKLMTSQCANFLMSIDWNMFDDKEANLKQRCSDTTCVAAMKTYGTSVPDCLAAGARYQEWLLTKTALFREACETLAAGGNVTNVTPAPPTPAPPPAVAECSSDQLSRAYKDEQAIKDACGRSTVFLLASTVSSDPQGEGKKICSNRKCLNALEAMSAGAGCTIQGLGFMNKYTRQYAAVQLACKTELGVNVGEAALARLCEPSDQQVMEMEDDDFKATSCGYAVPIALSPKNDTAATATLCKDTTCLFALEHMWMNQWACVRGGKNQHLYYQTLLSPIMDECESLGVQVEYASGLPPRPTGSSSASGPVSAVVLSVVAAIIGVVAF